MSVLLEKQLLDHMQTWIRTSGYTPTVQEKECLDSYTRNTILSGASVLGLFSWIGAKLVVPEITAWRCRSKQNSARCDSAGERRGAVKAGGPKGSLFNLAMSIGGVSGAAFVSTYYTARWSGTECVACLLKVKGEEHKLGDLLQDMIVQYHPKAKAYLEASHRHVPDILLREEAEQREQATRGEKEDRARFERMREEQFRRAREQQQQSSSS
ncbi:hypothetical protein BCR44DRAFT_137152, partial [Catenaria anguillulae PL171]